MTQPTACRMQMRVSNQEVGSGLGVACEMMSRVLRAAVRVRDDTGSTRVILT